MSERDELAADIRGLGITVIDGPPVDLTEPLAQHLHNLGYRKPRTITTTEELDTLPVGSVVLSQKYTVHGQEGFLHVAFQRWADGLWHRGGRSGDTHPDNFLPVTVLTEVEP